MSHFFSPRENPNWGLPGFETLTSSSLMLFACSPKEVALDPWPSLYDTAWKIRVSVSSGHHHHPILSVPYKAGAVREEICEMLSPGKDTAISITNYNFSCVHRGAPNGAWPESVLAQRGAYSLDGDASKLKCLFPHPRSPGWLLVNSLGHKTKENNMNAVKKLVGRSVAGDGEERSIRKYAWLVKIIRMHYEHTWNCQINLMSKKKIRN